MQDSRLIRPGDEVRHMKTGETLTVCGVSHTLQEFIPCGHPFPRIVRIGQVELVKPCDVPQPRTWKKALTQCGCMSFIEE